MTQDEIIKMSLKAGLVIDGNQSGLVNLEVFAKLVAAKEREEIAFYFANHWAGEYTDVEIVSAIRARGEQHG